MEPSTHDVRLTVGPAHAPIAGTCGCTPAVLNRSGAPAAPAASAERGVASGHRRASRPRRRGGRGLGTGRCRRHRFACREFGGGRGGTRSRRCRRERAVARRRGAHRSGFGGGARFGFAARSGLGSWGSGSGFGDRAAFGAPGVGLRARGDAVSRCGRSSGGVRARRRSGARGRVRARSVSARVGRVRRGAAVRCAGSERTSFRRSAGRCPAGWSGACSGAGGRRSGDAEPGRSAGPRGAAEPAGAARPTGAARSAGTPRPARARARAGSAAARGRAAGAPAVRAATGQAVAGGTGGSASPG